MANAEEAGGCYTLTWDIENFGLFLAWRGYEFLVSPCSKVEHTGGSAWMRLKALYFDHICFHQDWLHGKLPLDRCEMSLISSRGEVPLKRNPEGYFYIKKGAVIGEKRQSILPNDTLTLRYRLWEKTIKVRESRMVSVLQRVNLLWNIEKGSRIETTYTTILEKDLLFGMKLVKKEKDNYNVIVEEILSKDCWFSFVECKISIKSTDLRVDNAEYNLSRTTFVGEIEIPTENDKKISFQMDSTIALTKLVQEQLAHHSSSESLHDPKSSEVSTMFSKMEFCTMLFLSEDLLHLYREALHTDATLNIEGKSFPVHRNILAARSPVFRAMFEKDQMSEGRSGVVDIDDVDSETVDRMLVFLYGGSLENLQWEEASALYYAADKYDVHTLKEKCSGILKAGLVVNNACDLLVLSDKHTDQGLMKCTVDFLFEHEDVVTSAQWDELEKSNAVLAAKVTRQLFLRKKERKPNPKGGSFSFGTPQQDSQNSGELQSQPTFNISTPPTFNFGASSTQSSQPFQFAVSTTPVEPSTHAVRIRKAVRRVRN